MNMNVWKFDIFFVVSLNKLVSNVTDDYMRRNKAHMVSLYCCLRNHCILISIAPNMDTQLNTFYATLFTNLTHFTYLKKMGVKSMFKLVKRVAQTF